MTWTPNYDLRSTAGVEPDAEVAAMVERYEAQLDRELGQVLLDAASGDTMANHLIDYVRAAGTVAPVMEGRIVRED